VEPLSASETINSWTPEQCKTVLLEAVNSGYLGPQFVKYFAAVAIESELAPP
jgi:hypothetical protein